MPLSVQVSSIVHVSAFAENLADTENPFPNVPDIIYIFS
jgi:hypothetical protein